MSVTKLCRYKRPIILFSKCQRAAYVCYRPVPVEKLVCDGFHMQQGEVVLHESEQLYLALVLRVIDNKQV